MENRPVSPVTNRGRTAKNVIVTPLERLEGVEIVKYIGFVSGSAIRELELGEAIQLAVRGREKREKTIHRVIRSVRHAAIEALRENAARADANAVLGVRIHVWSPLKNVFEAYAYGTAAEVRASGRKRGK